ncbi:MAG: MMPL family transporter, partial [Bacteroidota bacterium]
VIVTIGITNAIYLLNKYHVEYSKQKNKLEAIRIVVQKMGLATFLTNLTVAIGFLTLLSTDITILREFGIVAGINIIGLFVVSLVMIPGILSWLPEPSSKHLKHLTFPMMGWFVRAVDTMVSKHRSYIYISATVLTLFAVIGIMRLQSVSFMVDDIPEESQIKKDLKFFEANFSGVMPLEIEVDLITKRKRPLIDDINNLRAIDAFEASLDSVTVISRPLSIITLVKAARQAFYNNNPERYDLPATKGESAFILRYMRGQGQSDSSGISTKLLRSIVDSSYSKMSIKMQMADIGSKRMDSLVNL